MDGVHDFPFRHRFAAQAGGETDLTQWQIVGYPKVPSPFETILESFGQSLEKDNDVLASTPFAPVGKAFKDWNAASSDRFMARMPYEMVIGF